MPCVIITVREAEVPPEEEKPEVTPEAPEGINWLPILAIVGAIAVAYYIKER